jgi:hypothetical protein
MFTHQSEQFRFLEQFCILHNHSAPELQFAIFTCGVKNKGLRSDATAMNYHLRRYLLIPQTL